MSPKIRILLIGLSRALIDQPFLRVSLIILRWKLIWLSQSLLWSIIPFELTDSLLELLLLQIFLRPVFYPQVSLLASRFCRTTVVSILIMHLVVHSFHRSSLKIRNHLLWYKLFIISWRMVIIYPRLVVALVNILRDLHRKSIIVLIILNRRDILEAVSISRNLGRHTEAIARILSWDKHIMWFLIS